MDFTKLPVDSLYKFLAIAGLAIAIGMAIYYQQLVYNNAIEQFKLLEIATTTDAEFDPAKDPRVIEIHKQLEELKEAMLRPKPKGTSREEMVDKEHRLQVKLASLLKEIFNTSERLKKPGRDKLNFLNDYQDSMRDYAWNCLVSGGSLSVFGFLLWYIKIQRHQDAILAKEASDSRRSTEVVSAS